MAFPQTALPIKVEVLINAVWTDITHYVYSRDILSMARGRRNETGTTDSAELSITLNNRDLRFSKRNPLGPYYGYLVNNTQIRVSINIVGIGYRFWGEISEWPIAADKTSKDIYVKIHASGQFRRFSQGSKELRSPFYRRWINKSIDTYLKAYWPFEDGKRATRYASGYPGGAPMNMYGSPTLSSDDSFVSSEPLPVFTANCAAAGSVQAYSGNDSWVSLLLKTPPGGVAATTRLMSIAYTGSMRYQMLSITPTGGLTLTSYDTNGTLIMTDGPLGFGLNGKNVMVALSLTQSGANTNYFFSVLEQNSTTGVIVKSGVMTGYLGGAVQWVSIAPDYGLAGCTVGHVLVLSDGAYAGYGNDFLGAYATEFAADRIARLAADDGVATSILGSESIPMGYQAQTGFLETLRECETADGGFLYEARDGNYLVYRCRDNIMSVPATLTLDYSAKTISEMEPVDDDQLITNNVTVSRQGGSATTATLSSGPLSTQDPPNGVGTYDSSVSVNTWFDIGLDDIANWRLSAGTIDKLRFPRVKIELHRAPFAGNASLTADAANISIGERLTITNPPHHLSYDPIDLLVVGILEEMRQFEWSITYICIPYDNWFVAKYDNSDRYSPGSSSLAAAATAGATTLSVAVDSKLWSISDGSFDILVSGERMTVTNITGTSSPQTFTVTRAVNGVSKAQASGATVELFSPKRYAMGVGY